MAMCMCRYDTDGKAELEMIEAKYLQDISVRLPTGEDSFADTASSIVDETAGSSGSEDD